MDQLLHALLNAPLREQFVVLGVAAIALALGAGFVGASIGAYFGGRLGVRRAAALLRRDGPLLPASQLDDVRQALDAIAVEVERISEGQRFTARLVADRVGNGAPATQGRNGGVITPH
jgi:hypothetical protein